MGINYNKPPAQPAGGTPGGSQPGVSLSKVTLNKSAPSVSLSKQGGGGGMLRVNLNWIVRPPQKGGFLSRLAGGSGPVDLDLGCLWELVNGQKGVVQALGNAFTVQLQGLPNPIIKLDHDDRSGQSLGGENLFIDLAQSAALKRVLVFAFIYEGVPNWAQANAVATLFPASGPEVEIRLDEPDPRAPMCAVAMIENVGGEIVVRREVKYVRGGQRLLDETFGWGMNWTPGRK